MKLLVEDVATTLTQLFQQQLVCLSFSWTQWYRKGSFFHTPTVQGSISQGNCTANSTTTS